MNIDPNEPTPSCQESRRKILNVISFYMIIAANADVLVTCGIDIAQTTPFSRNPGPDITTSASISSSNEPPPVGPEAQKDDSKEDDDISPGRENSIIIAYFL